MVTDTSIKKGYKQTELGVIPEDWLVLSLGELVDYRNGKSYESHITDNGDYFLVTLNSLDITGKLKDDHLRVSFNDKSLNKNDLIMMLSDVAHGYFLGLTDVIPEDNKYVLNQRVGALKNVSHLTPYYLSKYINLKQKYFKTAGQGSSQQNLSKDDILNFKVLFPPTKSEQTAITTVFSDTEALIERLKKLIAKKKAIKQGAMQQLLTGKKRLPGISGKWEVKKLGEVVDFSNGKAHENFISDNGDYIVVNSKFISSEGQVIKYSKQCFCPAPVNSILFVMSDVPNGKAIAKCFLVDKNGKYTVNQRICALNPKINARFLFYKINRNPYYLSFDDGVKQTNLRKDDVLGCKLSIPKQESEQTAIATILSDMDAEIKSLEQKRDKYIMLKQGMMQQLLTGRIRVYANN